MNKTTLITGLLLACASGAYGQLSVTAPGVAGLIDFNYGTIPGVYRYAAGGTNGPNGAEPDNWAMQGEGGRMGLDTRAWGWVAETTWPNTFLADANNNGNSTDRFDQAQVGIVNSTIIPGLGVDDFALRFNSNSWQDKNITLKVVNNTGATVNDWNLSVDAWFLDQGMNVTNLSLTAGTTYSNSGAGFTTVGMLTSTNAGNSGNTTYTSKSVVGGTVNMPVTNGSALYVQLFYDQNGGGNSFAIDNLSVTPVAVPEPATYAAMAGLVILGLAWVRRRK
ncbi:MAG: PEP-CTERM sorting domain-containing protein [Verrucomicrobiota bacterium]|nr:PEP-CTERM sorting domain-containing protein [Verrucomicrobiota bacterium]